MTMDKKEQEFADGLALLMVNAADVKITFMVGVLETAKHAIIRQSIDDKATEQPVE